MPQMEPSDAGGEDGKTDMIVVKIGDGMGNQLYNYACGYSAARREGDTLKLDTSEADNSTLRDFELDKFHFVYDGRESFPNRTFWQKVYKRLRRNFRYRVIKERDINALDGRVFEKKRIRNKYLHGYWQHLGYFGEYLDEITGMMTPAYPQSDEVKDLIERFRREATCAVHVRGGDIVGPGRAFFEQALKRMEQEKPGLRYIVFTNDMEKSVEALSQTTLGERINYVSELGNFSDMDEFFLMASCQNQIISNSSYSTWAAYLNPNPEKTVIVPEYPGCEQRCMKGWIIL